MGMDQYLRAKTNKREYQGATGACSGLFGIAPEDNGMVEIGYWRKAYDQNDLISTTVSAQEDETGHVRILKDEIDEIIEKATQILSTHEFDEEDGYDLTTSEDYGGFRTFSTFDSKRKWEDTINFFKEAKKILEEDSNAEIYYCIWC